MRADHKHPYQLALGLVWLALAAPLLWWLSQPAHLIAIKPGPFVLGHITVELFAVVVAMLIFITGYKAFMSPRKGAAVWLGIAFFGVGLFDGLHMLSDAGLPDAIAASSPQTSLFFGFAARLLAATVLLAYALLPTVAEVGKARKRLALALMLAIVCALGYVGLAWPDRLPAFSAPGQGLTPLTLGLEWLVVALNLSTLAAFWLRRAALAQECLPVLNFAVALSAVSELIFMISGADKQDSAHALGHVYKVLAYLYLFHATFNEALRRPLEQLELQHLREKLVLSAAPDGILWVGQNGQILLANPAMETLSGYAAHELVGQNVDLFLPPPLRARHGQSMRAYFTAPHPRAMGSMDLKLLRRDGQMLPIDISLGHWEDENGKYAIAYIRDLTERKRFEESLRHQAAHDELTGLPNRRLFRFQLNQALAHAKRSDRHIAALILDLDDFKTINDSFGHLTGDQLLLQVGIRLQSVLRENDTLARLGGDEFAILLTDLATTEEAVNVAAKLLLTLETPYRLHNQDVYANGSMGLAFYPDDAQDSENLLRYADMAMYQAKQAGRGAYACYSMEMDQRAHENMQLHSRLKEAIHHQKLKLLYQPQVSVASGEIVGAEALLRWHDDVLGHVPPARFMPVAETTGLVLPLSDWVLETACQQIAAWNRAGTPLRVAVNFSAQQFRQQHLVEKVSAVLRRTGAPAHLLEIEITESVAMTQPVQAREQLDALTALGCTVALDDFGTGYSSLAYLKTLPVSKLKIDRDFIKNLPHDPNDVKISRSIIGLARSFDLTLVAEGIETDEQLEFLRAHGCETYQGWLFAKALEAADLTARRHAPQVPAPSPQHCC